MAQFIRVHSVCNKWVNACLWVVPVSGSLGLHLAVQSNNSLKSQLSLRTLQDVNLISVLSGKKIAALQWMSEEGELPTSHTKHPQNHKQICWMFQGWICQQRPTAYRLHYQSGCHPSGFWDVPWALIFQDMSSKHWNNKLVEVDCARQWS